MSLRTPLSQARGLGSAKEGVHHWWMQRVTAVALVPLVLWFAFSVATLGAADHAVLVAWLARPWNTVLMVLFLVALLYHSMLGVQEVVLDYVSGEAARMVWMLAIKFVHVLLAAASVLAVLRVALA
jgi:succinate dehydrogenase / fumarate reductase, membrane anchor subunit